jgi:hypothetical protein
MMFYEMVPLSVHSRVNTLIQIKSEVTDARHVALNYLRAKLSFTQDVVGHLSMHQLLMMR